MCPNNKSALTGNASSVNTNSNRILFQIPKVSCARWDNGLQAYGLTLEDAKPGKIRHATTEILVWQLAAL
jgi:hypothetical protein